LSSSEKAPAQNAPDLWRQVLPLRRAEDHKYTRGAALVWSGGEFATGASRLTAQAALQIGAGLVTLAGEPAALRIHAAHVTAIMLRVITHAADWKTALAEPRVRGIAVGPAAGVGEITREMALAALAAGPAVVLDADALTSFSGRLDTLASAIKALPRPVILTPHEGEARALFEDTGAGSRPRRALEAALSSSAIVVLKGHETLIAAPDGCIAINTSAPPTLATAGSGDVLAGLILGLIVQGMPGFEAACCGVWLHGEIGKRAGAHPMAEDFINAIRDLPAFDAI
jgi:ADP-dependent NAD(P)H-hydrate dehydratase / NAD(P)H-hydrate epimerase